MSRRSFILSRDSRNHRFFLLPALDMFNIEGAEKKDEN